MISTGEGNGNPLQYSCLETPVDRGARWAAVHRVAQGRTRLKRLSMHACLISTVKKWPHPRREEMGRVREGEWREGWFGEATGREWPGKWGSSLHPRGPPGAVKALPGPGAQRLAQCLAQSRCSEALWGEWKPVWKSKASHEQAWVQWLEVRGHKAHTCPTLYLLQVGLRREHWVNLSQIKCADHPTVSRCVQDALLWGNPFIRAAPAQPAGLGFLRWKVLLPPPDGALQGETKAAWGPEPACSVRLPGKPAAAASTPAGADS